MSGRGVDPRRWLAAIGLLLLAPGVAMALAFYLHGRDDIRGVTRALEGLIGVEAARALLLERMADGPPSEIALAIAASRLCRACEAPNGDGATVCADAPEFPELLRITLEKSRRAAVRAGRELIDVVRRDAAVAHAVSADEQGLAALTLSVGPELETRLWEFRDVARMVAAEATLSEWDKATVMLAAGRLAGAAEQFGRLARAEIGRGLARRAPAWAAFDRADVDLRAAAAAFADAMVAGEPGAALDLRSLEERYVGLAATIDAVTRDATARLRTSIVEHRAEIEAEFGWMVGLFLAALVCAGLGAWGLARSMARRTLRAIERIGLSDPLTELPNRRAAIRLLDGLIAKAEEGGAAAIRLDLRRFKALNESYGEAVGDAALRSVAEALTATTPPGAVVARVAGSEFAILTAETGDPDALDAIAERARAAVGRLRPTPDGKLELGLSIGVARSSGRRGGGERLLTDAEIAVRDAKRAGLGVIRHFDERMRSEASERYTIARDLADALDADRVEPWFQPQVSIDGARVLGFEALVRWIGLDGAPIGPLRFLSVALEADLSERLETVVRRKALAAAAEWIAAGLEPGHIGLNIGADKLGDPSFVDRLLFDAEAVGLPPNRIAVEILETVAIEGESSRVVRDSIRRLGDRGVYLDLDDFGAGRAAMASLRELTVDRVKIDRGFVAGVDRDIALQKMCRALIGLARNLDIDVIAEGVETEAERAWLAAQGCGAMQGWLVARAMPAEVARAWLVAQRASAAA